ncbi:putative dna-directed rna polymerase i subunit rpa43 [Fagus crenata]
MEGLKVSDANLVVYVHPSKSTKVQQAVLRELSSLLFKFSENFDGVVLAYDFQIQDKIAKILPGFHPYFAVRLKAKLLLFAPRPNMLLEGKVVKLTQTSIHVIVLGFSSAIISDEDIREEFNYKIKHGDEQFGSRSHKRHVIKVGTVIRFLVKSFDEEILHISGSLVPANTGSIRWLARHLEEFSLTERSPRKRGESEGELVIQEQAYSLNNDNRIKKSKKHSISEES